MSTVVEDETIMWPPTETSKCKKSMIILTITVHAIDISFGIFMVVSAVQLMNDPLFAGILFSLGPLLLISSLSGIIGFLSENCRIGITIDIYTALIISIYEFTLAFLTMIMKKQLIQHMRDNVVNLRTTQHFINEFDKHIWVFWVLFLILAILELTKFFTLRGVDKYLREDEMMRRFADGLDAPLMDEGKDEDATSLDSELSEPFGTFARHNKPQNILVDEDDFSPLNSELHVVSLHWSRGMNNSTADRESVSSTETGISGLYDIRWNLDHLNSGARSSYTPPPKPNVEHL